LEAVGHAEAFDSLFGIARSKEISEETIRELHRLFYRRIDEESAGRYRKTQAIITGSKFPLPKPRDLTGLMKKLIPRLKEIRKAKHPVEAAALAHKEFVFIHPFIDGNGRVARLLMNLSLLQEGYSIAIVPPAARSHYIDSLEKAHFDDRDFIHFVALMVKETQKDCLRLFLR
jgi:Fic family protein